MSHVNKYQYSVLDLITLVDSVDDHVINKENLIDLVIEQLSKIESDNDTDIDEFLEEVDNASKKREDKNTDDDIMNDLKQDLRTIFGTDNIEELDRAFIVQGKNDDDTNDEDIVNDVSGDDKDEEIDEEDNDDDSYQHIEVDLKRLRLLDRLKFLLTMLPKLELIILALPTHISKNEPLIFVYLLDKLTDLQYLIKYLIARVNEYDVDSLELIIAELEEYLGELVETAKNAYYSM